MKMKKKSFKPDFAGCGSFKVLRFVPGDHVRIEFDASSFVEIIVMAYDDGFIGEKPLGKEDCLPF